MSTSLNPSTRAPERQWPWARALEEAVGVTTLEQLLSWCDTYIRPLILYGSVAFGIGRCTGFAILCDGIATRGFSSDFFNTLRNANGTVLLPVLPTEGIGDLVQEPLGPVNRLWAEAVSRCKPDGFAGHWRGDVGSAAGSFILFGQLPAVTTPGQARIISLLLPTLHDVFARVCSSHPRLKAARDVLEPLTLRETELLGWLVAGRMNREIAVSSGRSIHTINNHIRSILRKLRANNRAEAVFIAVSRGLVEAREATGATRLIAAQPRRLTYRSRHWAGKTLMVDLSVIRTAGDRSIAADGH